MQLWKLVTVVVCLAAITAGAIFVISARAPTLPPGTQRLEYQFSVGDTVGVDTGRDIFRLGQVTPGGSSWRTLSVSPTITSTAVANESVTHVTITAKGSGASWLQFEPDTLEVPGSVKISVHAPSDAEKKTYRGELLIVPVVG